MKIVIAGGSIAGLCSALTLLCAGHDVHVYERSGHALRGQGGGVVVLRRMLTFLERHGHLTRQMISVPTQYRRRIDMSGATVDEIPELLPFSSWDTLYRSLCAMLPSASTSFAHEVTSFVDHDSTVEVLFGSGKHVHADLLIAADGVGSGIRAALFPESGTEFAGYVAWRGVVNESSFTPAEVETIIGNLTLFRGQGQLFMTFLMPGFENSLKPGERIFNWVWYRNEESWNSLRNHLTDSKGRVHHASVKAGSLSTPTVLELRELALANLPKVLGRLVLQTEEPFCQAILDSKSPHFSRGRVVLVGDAACTVRPHTGSGTSKAAEDAVSLAHALNQAGVASLEESLRRWDLDRRLAVAPLIKRGPELAASFGLGRTLG